MKLFFVNYSWEGNFPVYIAEAFGKIGVQKYVCNILPHNHWLKYIYLQQFVRGQSYLKNKSLYDSNTTVIQSIKQEKPDVFFSFNNSRLFPETLKTIKESIKCKTVCLVADNPFDSSRDKYFALCLRYFNSILVTERSWIPNIRRMAPNSKIEYILGGYEPEIFKPIDEKTISEEEKKLLQCDISFTGSAYGEQPEGHYRAGILGSLDKYNVKIWGDIGWKYREKYYPSLGKAYQGRRLSYDHLIKLYTISKVNMNMPSPQTITAFQPRVFEIAAVKGFQILDFREDLLQCYNDDEMVTFATIPELKEKIRYYIDKPEERMKYAEKMYQKTVNFHTWEQRVKEYLTIIK